MVTTEPTAADLQRIDALRAGEERVKSRMRVVMPQPELLDAIEFVIEQEGGRGQMIEMEDGVFARAIDLGYRAPTVLIQQDDSAATVAFLAWMSVRFAEERGQANLPDLVLFARICDEVIGSLIVNIPRWRQHTERVQLGDAVA